MLASFTSALIFRMATRRAVSTSVSFLVSALRVSNPFFAIAIRPIVMATKIAVGIASLTINFKLFRKRMVPRQPARNPAGGARPHNALTTGPLLINVACRVRHYGELLRSDDFAHGRACFL